MELWRIASDSAERPKVLSRRNLAVALALHFGAFVLFWLYSVCHGLFSRNEEIIPIDLTVVVNENLDGKENEPPPLKNPEPEPPKPKPKPEPPKPKEPEKPKELEKIVTNIVKKVEKKKEDKKPEAPKKSAKELREERLKKMRESAKTVNKPVQVVIKNARESGDGRTEKRPADWQKLLNQGYRPGAKTQLAPDERTRCVLLIQRALDEKWENLSPTVGASGTVLLSVQFTSNGGMINVRLKQSCGDKISDNAALSVARRVTSIPGLAPEFIAESRKEPITVVYKVQGK